MLVFYGEEVLARHPIFKLEDHKYCEILHFHSGINVDCDTVKFCKLLTMFWRNVSLLHSGYKFNPEDGGDTFL
jgi:hypothetical protein